MAFSNQTVWLTALPAVSNRSYQLLAATNMATGFSPLSNVVSATEGLLKATATNTDPSVFYRFGVSTP